MVYGKEVEFRTKSRNLTITVFSYYFAGEILRNDVVQVLPFRNTLTMVDLLGSDLFKVFEHSVEAYGENYISGRFLQVSGIF